MSEFTGFVASRLDTIAAAAKALEEELHTMTVSNAAWKKRAEAAEAQVQTLQGQANVLMGQVKSWESAEEERQEREEARVSAWEELANIFVGRHGDCLPCDGCGLTALSSTCLFCNGTGRHDRPDDPREKPELPRD